MRVNVIRPFPFSRDGRTQEHATVGEQDIPDALVVGLVSEGYIEQPEDLPPIPMSTGRRKVIVDRLTELFRAHMEALSDDQLIETLAAAERETGYATKVVDDLEHGQPELFSVGPNLSGLAAIADVDFSAADVGGDSAGEALPPIEGNEGEQTAPPAFDPDTADEAALRAFLTTRDGKEPDKRFGPDRLRALAKGAPGADDQGE